MSNIEIFYRVWFKGRPAVGTYPAYPGHYVGKQYYSKWPGSWTRMADFDQNYEIHTCRITVLEKLDSTKSPIS